MKIPDYINCKENEDVCNYLTTKECPSSCPYAMNLGIGAMMIPLGQLEKEIEDGSED